MNKAITFMTNYCDFSNPNWVWIMTGLSRNKDNDALAERFMRRLVVTKPEDIEECWQEIHLLAIDPLTTYRIYISQNARDTVKTTFEFQKKLLDIGYGLARGLEDHLVLSKKIGSLWKTELAQNENRGTKRFLLDVDNSNGETAMSIVDYLRDTVKTNIVACVPTVSGFHIVFDACDTRGLMQFCKLIKAEVELQRDSMVFVEQWTGKA